MRLSRLNMGLFAAMAAAASSMFAPKEQSRRTEYFTRDGVRYKRTWRRNYPEQSSRQDMRRFRRANGGPGIYLNEQRNVYLPIGCPSLEAFEDGFYPVAPGARA